MFLAQNEKEDGRREKEYEDKGQFFSGAQPYKGEEDDFLSHLTSFLSVFSLPAVGNVSQSGSWFS